MISNNNFFSDFIKEVGDPNYNPQKFYESHEEEFKSENPPNQPVYEYISKSDDYKGNVGTVHRIGSKVFVPAAENYQANIQEIRTDFMKKLKIRIFDYGLVAKRLSIKVNGKLVDVFITGKRENIANGRWILYSNPNMASYEEWFEGLSIRKRMETLKANSIFFNYPGVGGSEGKISQEDMVEAYKAVTKLLEDAKGLDAKEIISWGTSIGGGVEGEALIKSESELKKTIKHVFVFDQTFGRLDDKTPSHFIKEAIDPLAKMALGGLADSLGKMSKWNLDTVTAAKHLHYPEVTVQNSSKASPETVRDIESDGIISRRASHARALLKIRPASQWANKFFIGVKTQHTRSYDDDEEGRIAQAIVKALELEEIRINKLQRPSPPPSPPPAEWEFGNDKPHRKKKKEITVETLARSKTRVKSSHKKHKSKKMKDSAQQVDAVASSQLLPPPSPETSEARTESSPERVWDKAAPSPERKKPLRS